MNYFAITGLINGLTSFFLGTLSLIVGFKKPLNRNYAFFAYSVFFWSFGYFFWQLARDPFSALFWSRFLMAGAIIIPSAFFVFTIELTKQTIHKKAESLISLFICLIFLVLDFTPLIVRGVSKKLYFEYWPNPGQLYPLFLLMFFYYAGCSLLLMGRALHRFSGQTKEQIKYVLVGTAIGFAGGSTNYFLWYNIPIPPVANILVSVYSIMVAYAILRHRLLDIEIIIKKTAVYSFLTALLTGLFVSIILLGNSLLGSFLGYNSIWFGTLAAFLVAFFFQPLRDKVQDLVDKTFFRARYDYQRILRKYSHALSQPMTDLDRFAHLAPYLLTHSMKLSGASVMVLEREEKYYLVRAGVKEAQSLEGLTIPEDSPLIQEIYQKKKELIKEEIQDPAVRAEMEKLKAVLIIPSISWSTYFQKPTLLCTTNLGEKLSGEPFSREDIEFLRTMANQASISTEYAFILEELRKHQEQIIKSEKMAALGTATVGIAHELKNPLTYIMTVAQTLPHGWDNPSFRESVTKMLPSEAERMKLILDGILDFSRTRELTLQPIEITEVLKKTLALLAYEIKKGKVYVKEEYRHTAKVLGDPNRLTQVFVNIINNAVQAMAEKGGDLTILSQDREKEVRISIIDTGPGMSKEVLQKIFDPFFTTKSSGTGLGLAITKKIIEEHHGSILVNSFPGRGTSFTVCLPQAELGYRV